MPPRDDVPELQAQQTLLRRYLRIYGPATRKDFSKWSGIPVSQVLPIWDSIKHEFSDVSVQGREASLLREDCDVLAASGTKKPCLRLLPYFDPYLLGHVDTSLMVNPDYYKKVFRNQGWISPVVLFNGRVIGTWSHKQSANKLRLEVLPFEKITRAQRRRIEVEAGQMGRFLDARCEITFSE